MGPKLKPLKKGPIDKFFKKKTDDENGGSSQLPVQEPCDELPTPHGSTSPLVQNQMGSTPGQSKPLDTQDKEPHETHSFTWRFDKKTRNLTCTKAGTIEESLKRSQQFTEIAGNNQNKELVIVKDGKAISSHFPCCLIKGTRLTVMFLKAVKAVDEKKPVRVPVHYQRKRSSGDLVTFHLRTRGDKNVANIIRNPALKTEIQEMTVYAYKGEKVKQALRRDGRLLKTVFKKNCELYTNTDSITEMSDLVNNYDGESFTIRLVNKLNLPESQAWQS
ncbi:protein FAM111A-like [Cottoperca gobio]|uniref:Protein FAM111A-like n=1 Tax=Cottoperca gobio TaxID=56716 RepID=A0A6J2QZH6_COTGO|nr:protein FAM111A-like [Cottoperca gobio]